MKFLGAACTSAARPENLLPSVSNYYIGDDPKRWHPNVPNYERVKFEQVYPGIDLVYYGNQQRLEYDFVLRPGAEPNQIRLAYSGADSMPGLRWRPDLECARQGNASAPAGGVSGNRRQTRRGRWVAPGPFLIRRGNGAGWPRRRLRRVPIRNL